MANIVSPFSSSFSLLPLSLPSSSSSSLLLFPSKLRPIQNPNHVLFSATQTQSLASLEPFSLKQEPLFTSELFNDRSLLTNFVEYEVLDLFESLKVSVRLGDVDLAEAIHGCVVKLGEDCLFGNSLISAYFKLGLVSEAYKVFLGHSRPDLVAFTCLISGFSKSNREMEAIELFMKMRSSGIEPNEFGFVAILTVCIRVLQFQLGFQVHALAIKTGFWGCVFVGNALMNLYSKSGGFEAVPKVFDEMPHRDLSSWNTAMSIAVKEGLYGKALELFREIRGSDFDFGVDSFTVSTILSACGLISGSSQGREVHALAIKQGLEANLSVGNALLGFYNKCGRGTVEDIEALFDEMPVRDTITLTEMINAYMGFGLVGQALEIFKKIPKRNSYSYNSLLAGFCQNRQGLMALKFFVGMISNRLELTDFSLSSVVTACGMLGDAGVGQQIHGFVTKSGCGSNPYIDSALIDMYARCGIMSDAEELFRGKGDSVISTTSMICGYARDGRYEEAMALFCESSSMVVPDEVALSSAISVCGSLGLLETGKQIHCLSIKSGLSDDLELGNSVISMYAKCWSMDDAVKAFDLMTRRDVVTWNGLISGYILHRNGDMALSVWSEMQKSGIKPDKVTFTLVISAYRHTVSNSVDQCREFFRSLADPTSEHIAAFVGVLGIWGSTGEAEEVIERLPFEPEMIVWRALLDSSRIQSDASLAERVSRKILATEPRDTSSFVLVSNLYSASGLWHRSEAVREEMREKGFKKQPGRSWIFHEGRVHSFYTRDESHSQTKDIYSGLEILIRECLKVGYVPDTSFVLQEVGEQQKRNFLFYHSAKLAAAYGVLTAEPGKPVRVVKNIALCGDCHEFLKCVSFVIGRDIILRDTSGFHCFSGGICSCKDYW